MHDGDDFPANTDVIGHAGRTLATVEAGALPYELTIRSRTRGSSRPGTTEASRSRASGSVRPWTRTRGIPASSSRAMRVEKTRAQPGEGPGPGPAHPGAGWILRRARCAMEARWASDGPS
jgi:hypothetical protein